MYDVALQPRLVVQGGNNMILDRMTLFAAVLLVMGWAGSSQAEMTALDDKSMRNVTGKGGLTLDFSNNTTLDQLQWRDGNGAAGGSGQGVLRFGDGGSQISIDNSSGGAFNLTGLEVNVDGGATPRSFFTLPNGSFTVKSGDITVTNAFGDGDQTTHFGRLIAEGVSFNTQNTLSVAANNGGGIDVNGDFDNPVQIGSLRYVDPDGISNGEGSVGLSDIKIEDTRYSAYSFDGATFDVDGSAGIVLNAPNDMNDVGVNANLTVNQNTLFGLTIGRSSSGIHLEGSRLTFNGRDDGIRFIPTVKMDDIDQVRLRDPDGISGTSQFLNIDNVQVGDIFGVAGVDPANLGEHTLDVDSTRGVVVQAPPTSESITQLDVALGAFAINDDFDDMIALDISDIDWRGSSVEIKPGGNSGDGLTINTELNLALNEIRMIDPGLNGFVSVGEIGAGDGIVIDNGSGGPASLTGMTIDADSTEGVVVNAPSGAIHADISDAHIGDASTSLGSFEATNFNVGGSKFRVQPH